MSDTEESFSGDEEDEAGGGEGEDKEPAHLLPLLPSSSEPTITPETEVVAGMEGEGGGTKKPEGTSEEEDKGDPEMAPIYLKKLLSIFAELFHSSLAPPLR